jgi:hypothetical protein
VSGLGALAFAPAGSVVVNPGIYNTDPNVGGTPGPCYFVTPGVYDLAAGLTISSGMMSNELRPPESSDAFWGGGNANCRSAFALTASATAPVLTAGTWAVWLTSIRSETIGGQPYKRESAPSKCQAIPLTNQSLHIVISNAPGAQGYNVYARQQDCAQPINTYGYVGTVVNSATEANTNNTACPQTTASPLNCSLGQTVYDLLGTPSNACVSKVPDSSIPAGTCGALMPDALTAPFSAGLPGQVPARAAPPRGDLANYNLCAAAGASATCPAAITPGAMQLYLPGGCLTLGAGADSFLFSGAQYNWIILHEPATNKCANNSVSGLSNTAFVGMIYTPGAGFTFGSGNAMQTPDFGGIIADNITISNAGGLSLGLNPDVAPAKPAVRLTG